MKDIIIAVNSENVEYVESIRIYNVKLPPLGVSIWKELGKKYGYWDYFEEQIKNSKK